MPKPLQISESPLSSTPRFYAFRAFKKTKSGILQVTGTKEDVTAQVMVCADSIIKRLVKEGHLEVPTDASAAHLNALFGEAIKDATKKFA